MKRTFDLLLLLALLLLGYAFISLGEQKDTSYKQYTVEELQTSIRIQIMKDLAQSMIDAQRFGEIDAAQKCPCAEVIVATDSYKGIVYPYIEVNWKKCYEEEGLNESRD